MTLPPWSHDPHVSPLQATTDKRNRLEELRRNARAQFALAKQLEEERNQCTLQQVRGGAKQRTLQIV